MLAMEEVTAAGRDHLVGWVCREGEEEVVEEEGDADGLQWLLSSRLQA